MSKTTKERVWDLLLSLVQHHGVSVIDEIANPEQWGTVMRDRIFQAAEVFECAAEERWPGPPALAWISPDGSVPAPAAELAPPIDSMYREGGGEVFLVDHTTKRPR